MSTPPSYQALENALRQIYAAAQAYERCPEESGVELLQNIQRLCDASLRGNASIPQIYAPIAEPASRAVTGRDSVLRMRDEFLKFVAAANEVGDYNGAIHAQQMAIALHKFEDEHMITNIEWPPRSVIDERGEAFGIDFARVD